VTGRYDFTINQGADFDVILTWTAGTPAAPVDLTGWTAHMQIRPSFADAGGAVYADLSSTSGGIVLGGTAGTIELIIAAVDTTALGFTQAAYDLKMTNPVGKITRLLQGSVTLLPEVTL
jgi:hypothetical protein